MIVLLFGVAGAGKTLIGTLLAAELGWKFYDADLFHSTQSLEKMRQGIPLDDADRDPWLERLCAALRTVSEQGKDAVLACSALKASYRERLSRCAELRQVFLQGDFDLIYQRLKERSGHFMNPELLESQFETLEEPEAGVLVVDVRQEPEAIVKLIRQQLALQGAAASHRTGLRQDRKRKD